jgi:ATP-dependent DNA helicase RecQ
VGGGWLATGRPWVYDAARYRRLADLRRAEHAAMRQLCRAEPGTCLMRFLTAQLDDPESAPCGRCGGCTGWSPDVAVEAAALASARDYLRRRDVPLHPRRQWPAGLADRRGRIAPEVRPEVGRALAAGTESGWGEAVGALLAAGVTGAETAADALAEVVGGLVQVLARWDWAQRPSAIVAIPSRTHGPLLHAICAELGRLGRLPVLPAVVRAGDTPRQAEMGNSVHLARNALQAYAVDPDVVLPPGPVLLVDVRTDSGWTLTAVSARLRQAHGVPVLPLVLTSRP